jgi:hypothetical protein
LAGSQSTTHIVTAAKPKDGFASMSQSKRENGGPPVIERRFDLLALSAPI